jgi:hypothetical protein
VTAPGKLAWVMLGDLSSLVRPAISARYKLASKVVSVKARMVPGGESGQSPFFSKGPSWPGQSLSILLGRRSIRGCPLFGEINESLCCA